MSEHFMPLQELALQDQACCFGVADLFQVETRDFLLDRQVLGRFPRAISLAVRVSQSVLETITEHPNQLYFHHYRQLNNLLDRIALKLGSRIEALGYRALPIAASQVIDWLSQRGHLSHKRIAVAAGLGWIGRNNLLVTPELGSQVRLTTVLTDLPLEPAGSTLATASCGSCMACRRVCPAQAIKARPEEFDHQACFTQLKEFQRRGYVGQYVCGICVKACGPAEARLRVTAG